MSAYLSSVPALFKLSHNRDDSAGNLRHDSGNEKPYKNPLKPCQQNSPTLADILRGADTITSITFKETVFHKVSESSHPNPSEGSFIPKDSFYVNSEKSNIEPFSYSKLLTSAANARPVHSQPILSENQPSQLKPLEDCDSIPEEMKLKGNKYKMKDQSKEGKIHNSKKGRRSRKRSRSAQGRNKGQNVVDRLYQTPQNSSARSTSNRQEVPKPGDKSQNMGLNLGAMEITVCKPMTIHNNRREVKSEMPRRTSERVYTATSSKSVIQTKSVEISKETVTLPQMTNNAMVKSVTQTEIVRKTNNFFSPMTQKLPMYVGSSSMKSQKNNDDATKVTKVYLSDKHSGTVKDCGIEIPCAPPATPTAEQMRKVEYVPSLNDIRSQRAVKIKLQVLEKEAQKKLDKQREEKERIEKQNKKSMEKDLKHQQRLEIYALNKVMTELENSRFKEFCAKKGIPIS